MTTIALLVIPPALGPATQATPTTTRQNLIHSAYEKPLSAHNYKAALAGIDKLIASDPTTEMQLGVIRYQALSNLDPKAANKYAKKLADGKYKTDGWKLSRLAWAMVEDKGIAKGGDAQLALKIAERSLDQTKQDDPNVPMEYDTVGVCFYKIGENEMALRSFYLAITAADRQDGFDKQTRKRFVDHVKLVSGKKR